MDTNLYDFSITLCCCNNQDYWFIAKNLWRLPWSQMYVHWKRAGEHWDKSATLLNFWGSTYFPLLDILALCLLPTLYITLTLQPSLHKHQSRSYLLTLARYQNLKVTITSWDRPTLLNCCWVSRWSFFEPKIFSVEFLHSNVWIVCLPPSRGKHLKASQCLGLHQRSLVNAPRKARQQCLMFNGL